MITSVKVFAIAPVTIFIAWSASDKSSLASFCSSFVSVLYLIKSFIIVFIGVYRVSRNIY